MPIFGTIVNGEVKYDRPLDFPEGARVSLELQENEEDFGPPSTLPEETYEEYIQSLRDGIGETDRGVRGQSSKEVYEEIRSELNLRSVRKG